MKNLLTILIISCLSTIQVFAQPVADFSVSTTYGCGPVQIDFFDNSTGNVVSYAWSFGDGGSSNVANPSWIYPAPASYTVCLTVTDDQGLTDELCMTDLITIYPVPETFIDDVLCAGESIVVLGVIYGESNPTGIDTVFGGSYMGCDSIIYVDLSFHPSDGLGLIEGYTIPFPCGMTTGAGACVTSVQCGVGPYTYDWGPPGETDACIDDLTPGTYNVTVTDAMGNTGIANFLVNLPPEILVANTTEDVSCFGGSDGSATVTVSGGVPPYTYAPAAALTDLAAGTYSIVVTDATGCSSESFFSINQPAQIEITSTVEDPICNGGTGCIDLQVSGGTPGYTEEWSAPVGGGQNVCGLFAGSYSVTITDSENCSATLEDIIISEPMGMSANLTSTTTGCNEFCIEMEVFGGTEPYSYLWSSGDMTAEACNLSEGEYSVTVTDLNNCTEIFNWTVAVPPSMVLMGTTTCATPGNNDGSIILTVSGGVGPYTYEWSNGANSQDITNLDAGTYSVTVTDDVGCTVEETFYINDLIVDITQDTVVCTTDDFPLMVDAPAANAYNWSPAGSVSDPTIPNPIATIDWGVNTFSVTITDDNGCEDVGIVVVAAYQNVYAEAVVENTSCNGLSDGSITLTPYCGTAPYTYAWSSGGSTTNVATGLDVGTYTYTVTDDLGVEYIGAETVEQGTSLNFNIVGPTNVCAGSPLTLCTDLANPSSYTFQWTGPAGYASSESCMPLAAVDITSEGCYTVEVTDGAGCVGTATHCIEVTTLGDVVTNAPIEDGYICSGGTHQFNIEAIPGTDITWSPSVGLSCDACFDPVASPAATTVYTMAVANGACVFSQDITVYVEDPPVVVVVSPLDLCSGTPLVACPSLGGGTAISWEWTTPTGVIITDECLEIPAVSEVDEGEYTVTVTFQGGCTASDSFTLNVETVDVTVSDDVVICPEDMVQITVAGADIAFVEWSPPIGLSCVQCPDPIASPLETITYTVLVVNNAGCDATEEVTITVDQNCVWPGDTDTNKVVNNYDLLNIGLAYDSVGPVRPAASLMWVGQEGPDWMQAAPNGSNYKHIDTDGNGMINSDDTLAITLNWAETHNFTGDNESGFIPSYPPAATGSVTVPFYVQPDTLIEGEMMSLPIILGEMGNPAEDVYGIAFTLEYDTAVVVPGSVFIGFDPSWLGVGDDDMIAIHRDFFDENKVDIGMTRIDGVPMTDFGSIASLFITVEDDLLFHDGGSGNFTPAQNEAVFNITNVLVINQHGEEIDVIPMQTTAQVDPITAVHDPGLKDYISVYPNPANDMLWVNTKGIELEQIQVLDVNGVNVLSLSSQDRQTRIDLKGLAQGTYFVKVLTSEGVYIERVSVIR